MVDIIAFPSSGCGKSTPLNVVLGTPMPQDHPFVRVELRARLTREGPDWIARSTLVSPEAAGASGALVPIPEAAAREDHLLLVARPRPKA